MKNKEINLKAREKEAVGFYTGAYILSVVKGELDIDGRRIEKLYYSSMAHRDVIRRAFTQLEEGVNRDDIRKCLLALLDMKPDRMVELKELLEDKTLAVELIDLISTDMEAEWKLALETFLGK